GGRHPHPERLGYTWLEFGRRAADGRTEFRTIGCGMKAVTGRGIARHWFFVTSQRVGTGLGLVSPTGVALTREKLREAVEGHGMVYDRASDYRRAVDEALFGLGEHRYEALVNLLIQLRAPQLSKKPDERLMSRALTEALPPLSPTLIGTVAEAFRGLDEERDALRALEEARGAATDFLGHYRRYAAIAAKRRAAAPRQTHSRYERLGREFGEAEGRYTAAQAELEAAGRLLGELAETKRRLEARREALQASPRMRDAERIEQMGQDARRRADHAARLEREHREKTAEADRRRSAADTTRWRRDEAVRTLDAMQEQAAGAARAARCADEHEEITVRWEADPAAARRGTEALAVNRSRAVAELDRLLAGLEQARIRLGKAREEVERLDGELRAAAERISAAEDATREGAAGLVADYLRYLTELTEIEVGDPDAIMAALESWAQTAARTNPAAMAVDDAARAATTALGRLEADLDSRLRAERQKATELETEISRLESGVHDVPPVPHTRDAATRTDRPGAPLWKVVDFSGPLPDEQRAGLEAALEASGVLDAWVTPRGELLAEDDTFVLSGAPVDGPSCATVLHPAVDRADPQAAALSDEVVRAVLTRIGLGPGTRTWVTADGRWVNGVLGGTWRKDTAAYIGEGAREAARRARLERLRTELAHVGDRVAGLERDLTALTARQRTLADEHRRLPQDTALREAHVRLAEEHRRRREVDTALAEARGVVARRQAEVDTATEHAAEFAADVGLPADEEELRIVRSALDDYRLALAGLWPAAESVLSARQALREATDDLQSAQTRLYEAAELATVARGEAEQAEETYRALVETAGAAVEELFRQLETVHQDLDARESAERTAAERERNAVAERAKAEEARDRLREAIREAATARDAAVAEFRSFAATGLLAVALPEITTPDPATEWAANPAVQLAREVNARLETVDDSDGPWERSQRKVAEEHKLLSDAMSRHGHSVGLTLHDGIMVVDVLFQGRTRDIPGLADALAEETGQRARLLSAREREILENHLLNEVSGELHERITAAEEEVSAMNAELSARPTSTGMRLRLMWNQAKNAPDGLGRIRATLRQTVDAWSAEDRTAVGAFLQERIAQEHADNPAAGWTEALTRALDYRAWHEFSIQRLQDGQWRPATGPASGGERVLAASVPLFAAASAHYKSAATPYAPRLVALDEAFAGVDDDSRAKCLGLLATFDMDVVMTSEREWGCYPSVPGLAICQLSRRDGIDAVLVTPWRWNGRERDRTPRPDPFPRPEAGDPSQDGLFA
ncbi:TIGR02680 family protein, partial [Actinoallomurus sp. NPDC052274]|uniref:TIGR02680 family protein n=1 Tax=Actinoallomurus sp. NPDC052274 TaxID=3155420 RepID=UPI003442AD9E